MAKNITNTESNTLISGTSGNDTIDNGGTNVSVNAGDGADRFTITRRVSRSTAGRATTSFTITART